MSNDVKVEIIEKSLENILRFRDNSVLCFVTLDPRLPFITEIENMKLYEIRNRINDAKFSLLRITEA